MENWDYAATVDGKPVRVTLLTNAEDKFTHDFLIFRDKLGRPYCQKIPNFPTDEEKKSYLIDLIKRLESLGIKDQDNSTGLDQFF